jgi:hypothetical protein
MTMPSTTDTVPPTAPTSLTGAAMANEVHIPPIGAAWTFGYVGERWEAVDAAMLHLKARGLLANRGH